MPKQTLFVENAIQQALMVCELVGQFSDGYWENSGGHDDWAPWCNATVEVAEPGQLLGRNFYAKRDSYNLSAKDLLEAVGDRMVLYARLASAGFALEEIKHLEYAFGNCRKDDDGKWIWDVKADGPTYTGNYFDKVRATIKKYSDVTFSKLEIVATNTAFDMKELKHQLYLLKKTMKVVLK